MKSVSASSRSLSQRAADLGPVSLRKCCAATPRLGIASAGTMATRASTRPRAEPSEPNRARRGNDNRRRGNADQASAIQLIRVLPTLAGGRPRGAGSESEPHTCPYAARGARHRLRLRRRIEPKQKSQAGTPASRRLSFSETSTDAAGASAADETAHMQQRGRHCCRSITAGGWESSPLTAGFVPIRKPRAPRIGLQTLSRRQGAALSGAASRARAARRFRAPRERQPRRLLALARPRSL